MNPEFLRLVRLELSPLRLVAAPFLLGLWVLFFAGGARDWTEIVDGAFRAALIVAAFWGARRAADAVAAELRERTWDAQRLSGLGPVSMTVGKLFGAPIGAWYVIGLAALLQIALIGLNGARPASYDLLSFGLAYQTVLAEILGAFALFAVASFASMAALAGQDRVRSFDTTLFQALAVGGGALLVSFFIGLSFDGRTVSYYDLELSRAGGLSLCFAFFGLWAALGLGHQMRKAFGARTTALPWILFLGALALFVLGWDRDADIGLLLGFAASAYAAALIEPHRRMALATWIGDLGRLRLRAVASGPAWVYAWIALSLALAILYPQIVADLEEATPRDARALFDADAAPIALTLFVLRDMGVCLWAGLRARDGRGLWTAALALAALWFVPVSLFGLTETLDVFRLFLPIDGLSIVSAGVQAAAAFIAALALAAIRK